jgi:hypothetical protein
LPRVHGADEINAILQAFRTVIAETLEKLISIPCAHNKVQPPGTYWQFGRLVSAINEKAGSSVCSVITLNYDVLSDLALFNQRGLGYDYGFEDGGGGNVPLLKLHGSLNWGCCSNSECKQIVPWHIEQYVHATPVWIPYDDGSYTRLQIASRLGSAGLLHCDRPIDPTPVIVPPTWNKID